MIKVGIIGCGRIADQHADEIQKISGCRIVGLCDKEELMAKQMAERFGIRYFCNDVKEFLRVASPDVVHITTPPDSHLELGETCLNAGCSVFFEKPFALNSAEVFRIIRLADENKLKITVGHNRQFSPVAVKMRDLINREFLGGHPVHLESIWCYSYSDAGYAKALLGDKDHWVRRLPGKMLHNIISHGVSRVAEYLQSPSPGVMAYGFTSETLKNNGENDIIDELRAIIYDANSTTAYFTFSTQMNPAIHQFRVYGPKRSLIADDLHQTIITVEDNYKSYLNHFIPPILDARQYLRNSFGNMKRFIKRDWHYEQGRKTLIEIFYQAVSGKGPLPIPYREIYLTSKIMDNIFDQINAVQKKGAGNRPENNRRHEAGFLQKFK